MKKSAVRAFGIACFLIGTLLALSHQFSIPYVSSYNKESISPYKEKIAELEKQLEQANEEITELKQSEKTKVSKKEVQTTKENTLKETAQSEMTDNEPVDDLVIGTLYIYSGLTPADVAKKLKDMDIIQNSVEMELFLAQPEYAKSIQKGQFEVNSSMSLEQIAKTITGKSQN